MKFFKVTSASLVVLVCSACGGGDDAKSSCQSIGSNTNSVQVVGGVDNLPGIADGNLGTFASFTGQASGSYVSAEGNGFQGGSNAGVFLTPPAGTSASDITVSTFLTDDSSSIESATGPTLTIEATQGDPAAEYASFKTTAPFNGVKLTINTPNNGEYRVYEVCGAASVR